MHLSNLNFSNFKNWKNFNTDLTKINLFFGQNSSGKSSIIQLLLLLKQTVENKDEKVVLYFGDDKSYVNLGNFDEVLNKNSENKILSVGYDFVFTGEVNYQVAFSKNSFGVLEILGFRVIDKYFQIDVIKNESNYSIFIDNKIPEKKKKTLPFDNIYTFYKLPFLSNVPEEFIKNVSLFENELQLLFSGIIYIGPLRENPKREYKWTATRPSHFGIRGENTFDAIITSVKEKNVFVSQYFNFEGSLAEIVCKWLIEFGMADDFRIESISEEKQLYQVNVKTKGATNWVDICDVGFGVSQILPIIALCYYAPQGSIIIIEQPEIHLHPKVQSGLGDLLIDAANSRGIQFIIESHSEHLLTRIQRRIAEEKIDGKEVKINFCNLVGGESVLEELKVNDFGEISNWPENFFGDEMEEIYQMQNAIIERKMMQESISDDNNI